MGSLNTFVKTSYRAMKDEFFSTLISLGNW